MDLDEEGKGEKERNGEDEGRILGQRERPRPKSKLDDEMKAFLERAAEGYAKRMHQGEKIGVDTILEDFLSAIMKKEREFFLQEVPQDQANGFYSRTLQLAIGKLNLKVPRVRLGNFFRPGLLPPKWKRVDKDYENLLLALLTNGYSQTQIERALHALNLPYSQDRIEDLTAMIHERFEVFRTSPLEDTMFAVFIDAYHAKMKVDSRMRDVSVFTALGIDMNGRKSVLGFWVVEGDESKAFWGDVFQDLVTRGLKRVLLFATDDFPGVREIMKKLYPFSDHQLCFLHMQRNLRIDLPKKVYAELKPHLYMAKESQTKEDGLRHFEEAVAVVERTDRAYAERLRGRANNYLAFLAYPAEVRKFIYTTNAVESINSGLDYIRRELGGYFPSEALDVNYFVQIVNMNDSWMRSPLPMVASRAYELRQILTMKFELKEEEALHNV